MKTIEFNNTLKKDYEDLYTCTKIRPDKLADVDSIVNKIVKEKARYQAVGEPLGIPWYVIGIIHNMECGQRFTQHLHNGDPLTGKTIKVPKGRPRIGQPPFSWEESATDALRCKNLDKVNDWSLTRILYELERYNGWGYRLYYSHVNSPYLWSCSNHYTKGKYIADNEWSETAVSQQIGAATLLQRLEERNEINSLSELAPVNKPFFTLNNEEAKPRVEDLQCFLNTFDEVTLVVDGIPGTNTSKAVKMIFGNYLSNNLE
ncbi:hypothetical protein [Psychrobacter sp. GP33]|uniref:hypothetical protein n=1 Tax=Psychrobacter sp. GP33 TaxID=2758709 RepID=UPI0015FE1EE6|nr:hypothetical protein [Psychrobacter sp. GP33]